MATVEMNGNVSRSGRVIKKSAKLIEMEETPTIDKTPAVGHRTPSSTKKKAANSLPKLKITIGGTEVNDNGDCYNVALNNDVYQEEVVEEEIVDHFEMVEEMVVTEDVVGNVEESTPIVNSTEPPLPSLKMKLNVSKGTAELETSSSSQTLTPVKKGKTKSNRYTQEEGEAETEANKLFKQIEAGILTPTPTKPFTKNSTATTFNHSTVDVDFSASTFNSATAKTKSTGEKGKKKSPPIPTGPKEKKPFITGYGLWSKEMRPKIQAQHPELDFPTISKKLGEMWNNQISKNEKHQWKLKADKMKAENEQRRATVISTGPQAVKTVGKASTPNIHLPRVERMTPIDVACHLKF